jgi:hypothetical protein
MTTRDECLAHFARCGRPHQNLSDNELRQKYVKATIDEICLGELDESTADMAIELRFRGLELPIDEIMEACSDEDIAAYAHLAEQDKEVVIRRAEAGIRTAERIGLPNAAREFRKIRDIARGGKLIKRRRLLAKAKGEGFIGYRHAKARLRAMLGNAANGGSVSFEKSRRGDGRVRRARGRPAIKIADGEPAARHRDAGARGPTSCRKALSARYRFTHNDT